MDELRVAVVGAGRMGADHVRRIATRTAGARVVAVVDVASDRATAVASASGAAAFATATAAFAGDRIDAVVVATPGDRHEDVLLEALALDIPILCEKPLAQDAESARRIVAAETRLGHRRIQVGFMRRFDAEYRRLREVVVAGSLGELLLLHHRHRNPAVPEWFTNENLVNDSVVHEFDAIRFFTGDEITSVQVRHGRTTKAAGGLADPQMVLLETATGVLADVEIFANAQYGYQVATQAVFEGGVIDIGATVTPSFLERYADSYDAEVQAWVDAARRGDIGGPSSWDGYAAAACCVAGVEAQRTGGIVPVLLDERPDLY